MLEHVVPQNSQRGGQFWKPLGREWVRLGHLVDLSCRYLCDWTSYVEFRTVFLLRHLIVAQ